MTPDERPWCWLCGGNHVFGLRAHWRLAVLAFGIFTGIYCALIVASVVSQP